MNRIFKQFVDLSRPAKRAISVTFDLIVLAAALWLAFSLRVDRWYWPETSAGLMSIFLANSAITIFAFVRLGLYRAIIRFMGNQAINAVFLGVTVSAVSLAILGKVSGVFMPRSVPVIYWALALVAVGGTRMLVRAWLSLMTRPERERVVIYGAGEWGMQLASALQQGHEFQPVAFIDDSPSRRKAIIHGVPVFDPSELSPLIGEYQVRRIFLALGGVSRKQTSLILRYLESFPVKVQTVPSMSDVLAGHARIGDIRELELEDLLGRDAVQPELELLAKKIRGKVVMVTGAGGSIGSELCRQMVMLEPTRIVLFDLSEYGLYQIEQELQELKARHQLKVELSPVIGSVQKEHRMEIILQSFGVQTLYHAAAYKHVPLVEHNVVEGVRNNVFGTWYTAEAAIRARVETFVLVSTDKAVRPTNVMGASKRMAELVLQGLARRQSRTCFCMVRFGNVLGSSGSVVPLFRQQIMNGGPVKVTHPDIYRYFMTIPEAAQLVLQASSLSVGGDVFVLDMGEHVRIADLARKMVHLMGYSIKDEDHPHGDIEIVYSGLRPGEKLYEELLIGDDPEGTVHPRILKAHEVALDWDEVKALIDEMDKACHLFDCERVREVLKTAPTAYSPTTKIEDLVWHEARQLLEGEQKVSSLSRSRSETLN